MCPRKCFSTWDMGCSSARGRSENAIGTQSQSMPTDNEGRLALLSLDRQMQRREGGIWQSHRSKLGQRAKGCPRRWHKGLQTPLHVQPPSRFVLFVPFRVFRLA